MVQGTMSNAGKSLLAAGLCRIFKQDGYRVAPFKSQNMALNSFITEEGLEMGRAQVMQAEAAGIKPSVLMNPILLKPTNDVGSQVIVNGEVLGTMSARDYFKYKKKLVPDIMKAYDKLASENDIIVIEGAGSPAEINLKTEDIVNMGMAKMAKAQGVRQRVPMHHVFGLVQADAGEPFECGVRDVIGVFDADHRRIRMEAGEHRIGDLHGLTIP